MAKVILMRIQLTNAVKIGDLHFMYVYFVIYVILNGSTTTVFKKIVLKSYYDFAY